MQVKTIDVSIYKTHLTVFLGGKLKDIKGWLDENIKDDKHKREALYKRFKEAVEELKGAGTFVWYGREFFVWVENSTHVSELVHELYHAANYILSECGVEHDEKNEPCAYLLEYLVKETIGR